MSKASRLFSDHLAAGYGGKGYFNPCLAFIISPNDNSVISNIDRDHEVIHAIISSESIGKILFLCRYTNLQLWYLWAYGKIKSLDEVLLFEEVFNELIQNVIDLWKPFQEGAAFKVTQEHLVKYISKDDNSEAIKKYYQTIHDLVQFGNPENPIVKGWMIGNQIDQIFGNSMFTDIVAAFSDPAIPEIKHSILDWLKKVYNLTSEVLNGISVISTTTLKPNIQNSFRLREEILSPKLFTRPLEKQKEYFNFLINFFSCKDFPKELRQHNENLLTEFKLGGKGLSKYGHGIHRISYFIDYESNIITDKISVPKIKFAEPSTSNIVNSLNAKSELKLEEELNYLAILDSFRKSYKETPQLMQERIQLIIPRDYQFIQVLFELLPFYKPYIF